MMLLTVWMYAYLRGVLSTRAVEDRCRYDATFRVACGREVPDHTTFSRFRKYLFAREGLAGELFCQVLRVCACAGLGRLSVVAGDGAKIAASASKEAGRGREGGGGGGGAAGQRVTPPASGPGPGRRPEGPAPAWRPCRPRPPRRPRGQETPGTGGRSRSAT